ncbi:MAG: TonB-dependent receptor [Bacteroidetes bacterium]|nr:TonB-dependent receptor [Bacteroidota bacterium]
MSYRILLYRFFWLCFFFSIPFALDANGQDIRFDFSKTPLSEALVSFREVTGVDVVYSPELVAPFETSCVYRGNSPRSALICIVLGLPFRTQEVGRNQLVLIPLVEDGPVSTSTKYVLSGFVYDFQSHETLIGAHVLLPGIGAGTTTNDAGYFAFPGLPGRSTELIVSYIGYERLDTTIVVGPSPIMLSVHPQAELLGDVTIEQESVSRSDLNATPGLIALSPRQLSSLPSSIGGNDVIEALRWMPGVERAGEATGGLLVRGSGPDQNLYLIDGAPIYHPWHAFSLISTFQTDTFKNVLFYKGAFPAEYGGRLSAVLDAELRDGARTLPKATIGLSALNANFLIESPINSKSSFMLSGRRSYLDKLIGRDHPVEDDSGRKDTLRTGYYFYDWSAKLSYRPDTKSKFSLSYYSGSDNLDLRLPFDLSLDFSSWLRPADLFFEIDQNWGNRILSGRYQRLISSQLFLTLTSYRSTYSAAENTFIRPTQSAFVRSQYSVDLEDLGAQVDFDYYPALNHQIRAGLSVVKHQFDSTIDAVVAYTPNLIEPLTQASNSETTELAVYAQDFWRMSSKWTFFPGVRLSYFGKGGHFRAAPRLTIQYSPSPKQLIIRASAASQIQYIQRIRDRHSFLYDLVSSRWIPTDSKTQPSKSDQITIGIESGAIRNITVRADLFVRGSQGVLLPKDEFQSKDGLLGPGIEISTLLGQHTSGNERSYGVELGVEAAWKSWKWMLGYTGLQTESRATGLEEATFKPTRFEIPRSLSIIGVRETARWTLGASIVWRSGYPLTVPVSRYQLTDAVSGEPTWFFHNPSINNGRLPAYFRLDINFNYKFKFAKADWSAGVNLYNVINRRNVVGQTFDPASEIFKPNDRLGLPLLPLFDLKMSI